MATRDLACLHDKLASAHRAVDAWEDAVMSAMTDAWKRLYTAHSNLDDVTWNLGTALSNVIRDLPTSARAA